MSLAAAFAGLQIEYVDGVTNVSRDYLPPGGTEKHLHDGGLGAWRAHMNALRTIVERNLTSALVLEDDADWDVRIKSQMQDFASASRLLIQPLSGTTDQFLDPSYPVPSPGQKPLNFDIREKMPIEPPFSSPYGDIDRWDFLWVGHCGTQFPLNHTPLGRVVIWDDETVPDPEDLSNEGGVQELVKQYPAHTRVVSRAHGNTCTLAYAVSQAGARRFLYELGVNKMDKATDVMFRSVCDGENGRRQGKCLTVQPQLFNHHRPVGSEATFSDIQDHGDKYNEVAYTRNVRWSTRVNFGKLVNGETDYIDDSSKHFGPG
jgi:GR25 family glycosyltransferase involved in LPS biosynthesis